MPKARGFVGAQWLLIFFLQFCDVVEVGGRSQITQITQKWATNKIMKVKNLRILSIFFTTY